MFETSNWLTHDICNTSSFWSCGRVSLEPLVTLLHCPPCGTVPLLGWVCIGKLSSPNNAKWGQSTPPMSVWAPNVEHKRALTFGTSSNNVPLLSQYWFWSLLFDWPECMAVQSWIVGILRPISRSQLSNSRFKLWGMGEMSLLGSVVGGSARAWTGSHTYIHAQTHLMQ